MKADLEIAADGTVNVCAWCHPGDTVKAGRPDLAGAVLNHGICQTHTAQELLKWQRLQSLLYPSPTETATGGKDK